MLKIEYVVNSIFDSMTWLLSETESDQVWLVDCGDIGSIKDKVNNKYITGVLLTHAHYDHIYGLPELLKLYPGCRVYTNEVGRETLADSKQNLSFFHESPLSVVGPQVTLCREGDEFELFPDVIARVYETPGHHPSCLTFMVGDYLFTGDAYIPGIKVVTNLPKADKTIAQKSLERIKTLAIGKTVLPGHHLQ